jgi:tetratricopeptide (TPR) repeat protein
MGSIKRHAALLACLSLLYLLLLFPFVHYMNSRPVVERLGVLPNVATLRFVSADQKLFLGSSLVMKVIIYFGGLMELSKNKVVVPPDYPSMSRMLHAAVKLDPYNTDAYYFSQAFLTWDARQFQLANNLLIEGMKYRTWDWSLPFYVGFNSYFFLKDYALAAHYYQKAAELSGSDLHANLAGRFMQESGRTEHAIAYLEIMLKGTINPVVKRSFQLRLGAFRGVAQIEKARDAFRAGKGRQPFSVEELRDTGFLSEVPRDPYGGSFVIEPDGRVTTTSKFASGGTKK